MINIKPLHIVSPLALLPLIAFAQTPSTFREFVSLAIELTKTATTIGWALLGLRFVYGVFKFLSNFDNEKEREEGKRLMFWSIIAVAILVMIWGILTAIQSTIFDNGGFFGIPTLTPPAP